MPDPQSFKKGIGKFGRSAISGALAAIIILSSFVSTANLSSIPAYSQLQNEEQGDFVDSTLTGGLDMPAAMAFAPDGRLFISEKGGNIRVVKDGILLSEPFASLPVNSRGERGLLGIALDPDFVSNHHLYAYYTTREDPVHNRVSRLTADPANPDLMLAGSELPILDLEPLATSGHNGGALAFGPDGKLYVSTGDDYTRENAQKLTSRLGKILRINPDGSIPEDNPFFNAPEGARKEIWALGLRNPFTFAFSPVVKDGGKMYINDVGRDWAEQINVGFAGANYGWPRCEGACLNPDFVDPLYAYTHEDGSGKAITGGAFYEGGQFPAEYLGSYFFGDYVLGFIKRLTPDGRVMDFQNASSPVDIDVGPDGSLYYLSIGEGAVHRIQHVRHENEEGKERENGIPIAMIAADTTSGTPPLAVTFDGSASTDPEQDELFYQWDFGDGSEGSSGVTVTHTYDAGGSYVVTLLVDDGNGGTSSATASIVVGNLPITMINSPSEGALYSAGDTIFFSGASRDKEDGILPDNAFSWQIVLHHNIHTHPFIEFEGVKSGNFTVPKVMETAADVWFRVHLSVRDFTGLVGTAVTDIHPERAEVVINSNVRGAQIMLDGQPKTTPHSFTGVVGVTRTLQAPAEQVIDGQVYRFRSWSDGGEPIHTIDTPAGNVTYTAEYVTPGDLQSNIVVNSLTVDGGLLEMWTSIVAADDGKGNEGITPLAFAGQEGKAYTVTANDYQDLVFDHWEDGSTDRVRTVTAVSDTTLTAYYKTPPAILTVKSADLTGNVLNGMYATVVPINNSTIKAAFTNSTYVGYLGNAYKVTASDYAGITFDHWEDGTTNRSRTVMLYGDRDITAHYNTGNSVMALTPAVHVSKDEGADLTVNTVSLDGADLNMWIIVQPQGAGRYAVFVHDYDGYVFDHWEDGSTDRVRTLTIEEATTMITAYYRAG
jgi:glucose/arabinose dehydrogenase/PKD repeat protein